MPLTHRYVGKNEYFWSVPESFKFLTIQASWFRARQSNWARAESEPNYPTTLWPPSSFPPFFFRPSNSSAWNMDKEMCVLGLLISRCNGHFNVQYFPTFPALHFMRTCFSTIDTKIKVCNTNINSGYVKSGSTETGLFNFHLSPFLLGWTTPPG